MELDQAKDKFIQTWGSLGSQWGISRTMAQIHALLLVSEQSLSTEDMMEKLQISRGNVNLNTRALIDWGIVFKEYKIGERREFFYAEKDIWVIARKIVKERRKRELLPVINALSDLKDIDKSKDVTSGEIQRFEKQMTEMKDFSQKMDGLLDKFEQSDRNWLLRNLLKLK